MDNTDPRWAEFIDRLAGPEGCNFHYDGENKEENFRWKCGGHTDQSIARKILAEMGFGEDEIENTLAYTITNGGYCDCEIVFNVGMPKLQ